MASPLTRDDGSTICGNYTLSEYLDEKYQSRNLTGTDIQTRAEVRRLTEWFDIKFYEEVSQLVINEKFMKRYLKRGDTEAAALQYYH